MISVPLWLAVIGGVLATWAAYDKVLMPALRWFVVGRANVVLSYAVGEWARSWPLSALIRSMGAYFVRRNSKDELYRRVLEDRTLLLSADPNARKPNRFRAAWNTLGFVGNNLRLVLKSDWHRFGYACVNFGAPVSMREYCALRGLDFQKLAGEERRRAIGDLGKHLMATVGKIVPVVPVPLIASVLLMNELKPISELELKSAVEQLIEKLEAAGDLAAMERERAMVLAGISHNLRTPLARLRLAL